MTICNPSEPAKLHCLTRWPRYSSIGQYCVNRAVITLHTAYRRQFQRFAGRTDPRQWHFLLRRRTWGPMPNSSAPMVFSMVISFGKQGTVSRLCNNPLRNSVTIGKSERNNCVTQNLSACHKSCNMGRGVKHRRTFQSTAFSPYINLEMR